MPMGRGTYGSKVGRPAKKKLAGMYGDKSKVTRGDIIMAAKKKAMKKASA